MIFPFLILILCFVILKKNIIENFIEDCLGKRDGVSGCRDCCKKHKNNYNKCVSNCMNI